MTKAKNMLSMLACRFAGALLVNPFEASVTISVFQYKDDKRGCQAGGVKINDAKSF